MAELPEWARGMEPTITHGEWEIDPSSEPVVTYQATALGGSILSTYVTEYTKVNKYAYRREHRETWSRPGHYDLAKDTGWESGVFTDNMTFRRVWVDHETWGRKTWERKDCGHG